MADVPATMGRMQRADLLARLRSGPMLSDGGMGASLVDLGAPVDACFEALNVESPEMVERVHRSFVEAGAELLLTNTFGGNRYALARKGFPDRLEEFNRAGVEVARRTGVLVGGSVGPLRVRLAPYGRVRPSEAFGAFREQMAVLVDAGVDLLVVETQVDLAEVEQAVAAARDLTDLPLVVTLSFTRDDRTLMGDPPEHVAARLAAMGVDAMGANCGEGPAQALRVIRQMRGTAGDVPLVARANAGGPQQVAGRFLYPATPVYFAEQARAMLAEGVALIGGCCGTTPAHISAVAQVLASPQRERIELGQAPEQDEEGAEAHAPTELSARLADGRFVVAVEVEPPRGHSAARMLAAAETLAEAGADVIDVADSPLARLRMSPWAACRLIQEQVKIETVLHFPTRGRNLLRLQGDLLAVHALGIRNLFVVLGDPITIGDYPGGSDNVDVAPSGLISIITGSFNQGRDQLGTSIGEPTSFLVGCAVNPNALDLPRECRLLHRKVEAGASFALSQAVYSPAPLRALRQEYEARFGPLDLPILAGVLPLLNGRHAEFLHNEVPGISIPEDVRDRMRRAGERGEQEGLRLAAGLASELREAAGGIYLMPQFRRYDLAAEVVDAVRASA